MLQTFIFCNSKFNILKSQYQLQKQTDKIDNTFELKMDALLIIIIVGMCLLMLGLSLYLLIVYVHPDDKGWGTAVYCKILVILGMLLVWSQALMLPLDVANNHFSPNSGGIDMKTFWSVVYISTLVMITILLPFAMLFYETDQDHTYCKRFLTASCYLFIALSLTSILLFVSWNFLKYADIPVTSLVVEYGTSGSSADAANVPQSDNVGADSTMTVETSFVVYSMAIMSFIGWILLILFGGVGLFALPVDWINDFRKRPKPRRSEEMLRTREALMTTVEDLKKECDELKQVDEAQGKNDQAGFFSRLKSKRQFQGKMSEFRAQYTVLEEEYEIFKLQLQYADQNPIIPWLKLVCAIFFLITAILWIFQLVFGYLAMKNDRPLIPFLNELLVSLQNAKAGFIATFLYSYFILYLVWAVVKGNVKFGLRIPLIVRFYPMKPNQTWMNSFLFNIILLLLASVGITQLATGCFPTYTRNTAIYNMFGIQVNYMRFYRYLYQHKVFGIAFVVWAFLTLIYLMITCNKLPKYAQKIEAIRRGHTGKADFQPPKQKAKENNKPVSDAGSD